MMKISVKLPLFSVILTALAIISCCTLLLITTANNHIENAIQSGVAELRMLNNSFTAEMNVVGDDSLSDTARRSLILYVFRKYTEASVSGSRYVLTDMAEPLYNDSPIDPRPLLPDLEQAANTAQSEDDARWPYVIAELNGRRYLIVGHWEATMGSKMSDAHEIYLVRDITDVYSGIAALGLRFASIALAAVLISAAVMILFIRRALRPLADLQEVPLRWRTADTTAALRCGARMKSLRWLKASTGWRTPSPVISGSLRIPRSSVNCCCPR